MLAITRAPQLLVKLSAAPAKAAFRFANKSLTANFEKLFTSIPPASAGLGIGPGPEWYVMSTPESGPEVNSWDLCHHLVSEGLGIAAAPPAHFAEPDLKQQWLAGSPEAHALAALRGEGPEAPDPRVPSGNGPFWFRDAAHSQLELARAAVGEPSERIRIAHLDTGYDPAHSTLPRHLRADLQRNFVDKDRPNDASDCSTGFYNNLGHGTGTLSILAGGPVADSTRSASPIGGAPFLEIVPIRVANAVIIFENSSIAKALDYVHSLHADPESRVHVITMSMGGLASRAWADAVNALYDLGVFIVTAAGNNFGNLPTHNIVYPARFNRVIAACGAMADGKPYADLPPKIMAGNYGPSSRMDTAISGFTPNTPWARFGAPNVVDFNGAGTSAATPQVAAAAALWIQKWMCDSANSDSPAYAEAWMRVEAVRKALFDSALHRPEQREHFGNGFLQANAALALPPAKAQELKRLDPDTASFPFLRVLTGQGIAATQSARQEMLELEALQISQQSRELSEILPDPDFPGELSPAARQRVIELLHDAPGASRALRGTLAPHARPSVKPASKPHSVPENARVEARRLAAALDPPIPPPTTRPLKVFAFDPLLSYRPGSARLNETVIEIDWEDVKPGPVGEYLEVVDVDPASGCCYAPLDLNHRFVSVNAGLAPSENNPRFHQQMAYAVAMKTIKHFETALGRVALWAPRFVKYTRENEVTIERQYVQRLRIYPHALREPNSYYSPDKKALLLGYFPASLSAPGENLPGGSIFCCLSHDIVAHETTHALLDGLHRYFAEPTNKDVLAFHEAIADIVALFQHFTIPEALRSQIEKTRGNLSEGGMLADLALQFGQGIGQFGALRSAIQNAPTRDDYESHTEPHARGAVLVAAVFEAFLDIYKRRSRGIVKLAAGAVPESDMRSDLVDRLANEAAKIARHVLNICIRALDYCPPVDVTFGEFLRALITADRDLVPQDAWDYRAAFVQGFTRRGIYPENVRSLSIESLCWEPPEFSIPIDGMLAQLDLSWDLRIRRENAYRTSQENARRVHQWITGDPEMSDDFAESLGFLRNGEGPFSIAGKSGTLRRFEVHSVRPVRRVGPDGQQRTDLVIEIAQTWVPDAPGAKFRGGCTLIIDLAARVIRYVVRKRVGNSERAAEQEEFQMSLADSSLALNYFVDAMKSEPFAIMHRAIRRDR